MLDAGIDVFSTVNVQHLESLNDRIFELTGVRVRETFPDSVLASADEVVLIDLTPEALIQRLREGKVYPAERVPKALNSFFRVENLATLREVALREVAEEVEAKRTACRRRWAPARTSAPEDAPGAVRERLLALVTPSAHSRRLVRRASTLRPAAGRPSSTCSTWPSRARRCRARSARGSRRCAASPRCSAPSCWWRRATSWPRWPAAWRASAEPPT